MGFPFSAIAPSQLTSAKDELTRDLVRVRIISLTQQLLEYFILLFQKLKDITMQTITAVNKNALQFKEVDDVGPRWKY